MGIWGFREERSEQRMSPRWEKMETESIPIAVLYCSRCQKSVDLAVGKFKHDMGQRKCPRCGLPTSDWMNSYKASELHGVLFVLDERVEE